MIRRILSLSLITLTLLTACGDKWGRVRKAFEVGAPVVVNRLQSAGKLTAEEAGAIKAAIPQIVSAVKTKSFEQVIVPLGNLARLRITNTEAKAWLDDLLAVTSIILGVDIPTDEPQIRTLMKSVPKQKKPDLSDENLKRLEELTR